MDQDIRELAREALTNPVALEKYVKALIRAEGIHSGNGIKDQPRLHMKQATLERHWDSYGHDRVELATFNHYQDRDLPNLDDVIVFISGQAFRHHSPTLDTKNFEFNNRALVWAEGAAVKLVERSRSSGNQDVFVVWWGYDSDVSHR